MNVTKAVFLSVLIPAFNEEDRIRAAIDSIKSSMRAVGVSEFEIVVCDNNSSDETGIVARNAGARVVFEGHNQIARARNRAAAEAMGEWLIFMDADSLLSADLLEGTIGRMREGSIGGGGALVKFDRDDLRFHVKAGLATWNGISRLMGWAAGSYLFCLRRAWEETGGFPEEWYAAEEVAFSRLLKKWCRKEGRRFEVITEHRLSTSARKVEKHTVWQTVSLLLSLAVPGSLKNRKRCHYWYEREE